MTHDTGKRLQFTQQPIENLQDKYTSSSSMVDKRWRPKFKNRQKIQERRNFICETFLTDNPFFDNYLRRGQRSHASRLGIDRSASSNYSSLSSGCERNPNLREIKTGTSKSNSPRMIDLSSGSSPLNDGSRRPSSGYRRGDKIHHFHEHHHFFYDVDSSPKGDVSSEGGKRQQRRNPFSDSSTASAVVDEARMMYRIRRDYPVDLTFQSQEVCSGMKNQKMQSLKGNRRKNLWIQGEQEEQTKSDNKKEKKKGLKGLVECDHCQKLQKNNFCEAAMMDSVNVWSVTQSRSVVELKNNPSLEIEKKESSIRKGSRSHSYLNQTLSKGVQVSNSSLDDVQEDVKKPGLQWSTEKDITKRDEATQVSLRTNSPFGLVHEKQAEIKSVSQTASAEEDKKSAGRISNPEKSDSRRSSLIKSRRGSSSVAASRELVHPVHSVHAASVHPEPSETFSSGINGLKMELVEIKNQLQRLENVRTSTNSSSDHPIVVCTSTTYILSEHQKDLNFEKSSEEKSSEERVNVQEHLPELSVQEQKEKDSNGTPNSEEKDQSEIGVELTKMENVYCQSVGARITKAINKMSQYPTKEILGKYCERRKRDELNCCKKCQTVDRDDKNLTWLGVRNGWTVVTEKMVQRQDVHSLESTIDSKEWNTPQKSMCYSVIESTLEEELVRNLRNSCNCQRDNLYEDFLDLEDVINCCRTNQSDHDVLRLLSCKSSDFERVPVLFEEVMPSSESFGRSPSNISLKYVFAEEERPKRITWSAEHSARKTKFVFGVSKFLVYRNRKYSMSERQGSATWQVYTANYNQGDSTRTKCRCCKCREDHYCSSRANGKESYRAGGGLFRDFELSSVWPKFIKKNLSRQWSKSEEAKPSEQKNKALTGEHRRLDEFENQIKIVNAKLESMRVQWEQKQKLDSEDGGAEIKAPPKKLLPRTPTKTLSEVASAGPLPCDCLPSNLEIQTERTVCTCKECQTIHFVDRHFVPTECLKTCLEKYGKATLTDRRQSRALVPQVSFEYEPEVLVGKSDPRESISTMGSYDSKERSKSSKKASGDLSNSYPKTAEKKFNGSIKSDEAKSNNGKTTGEETTKKSPESSFNNMKKVCEEKTNISTQTGRSLVLVGSQTEGQLREVRSQIKNGPTPTAEGKVQRQHTVEEKLSISTKSDGRISEGGKKSDEERSYTNSTKAEERTNKQADGDAKNIPCECFVNGVPCREKICDCSSKLQVLEDRLSALEKKRGDIDGVKSVSIMSSLENIPSDTQQEWKTRVITCSNMQFFEGYYPAFGKTCKCMEDDPCSFKILHPPPKDVYFLTNIKLFRRFSYRQSRTRRTLRTFFGWFKRKRMIERVDTVDSFIDDCSRSSMPLKKRSFHVLSGTSRPIKPKKRGRKKKEK